MAGIVPNYNPVSVNFAGSNSALNTAERGFANAGSLADQILDRYNKEKMQAEQIRQFDLTNQRATEQFGLEKQKYADIKDARIQGNEYANALRNAVAPGVIGQQDQTVVGQKIADLGARAQAAYTSGDTRTGDRLVAEQQGYLGGNVPKMADKFQSNGQGKIDVLRSVTSGPMVDAQTQAQLYGVVANPIQNDINQQQQHGFRLSEIGEEAKLRRASDAARIAAETQAQLDRTLFMDPKTNQYAYGAQLKNMPAEIRGSFVPEQVVKNAFEAKRLANEEARDFVNVILDPYTNKPILVAPGTPDAFKMSKDAYGKQGLNVSGTGSKKDGTSALYTNKDNQELLDEMGNHWLSGDKSNALAAVKEAEDNMKKRGYNPVVINDVIGNALAAGKSAAFLYGSDKFNSSNFKDAIERGMSNAETGVGYRAYGIMKPIDPTVYTAFKASQTKTSDDKPVSTSSEKTPEFALPAKQTRGLEMGPSLNQIQQAAENARIKELDAIISGNTRLPVSSQQKNAAMEELRQIRLRNPSEFDKSYRGLTDQLYR